MAFEPLRPLGTKIRNALVACGASDQTINDFKTLNRKVQGKRAGSKLTKADSGKLINPNPTDPLPEPTDTSISAAQLSYDSYMDHSSLADNKAIAKAVETFLIFALQKSIKHLSLLVAFRQTMFQIKPLLSAKTLAVIVKTHIDKK